MTYWAPIFVLLKLRRQAASNDFAENPTTVLARMLLALVIGLVGLSLNNALGRRWSTLSMLDADARLNRLWLETQTIWALALLVPGMVALLGRGPNVSVLRAFPLRPSQILLSDLLASLIDTPTLIAVASLLPFLFHLCRQGRWEEAVAILTAFSLLGLLTVAMARLLATGGALLIKRVRRWRDTPLAAALSLVGFCVCAPPAFAALTTAPHQNPRAFHVQLPALPAIPIVPVLPSTFACKIVVSARRGDLPGALRPTALLASLMGFTIAGAVAIHRRASAIVVDQSARSKNKRSVRALPLRLDLPASKLTQLAALIVTDWRLLLRGPGTYLPLRQPAALLLVGALAFIAPDMGHDPVYSIKELLGLGGVLYNVLWQIQLLCNRFGCESGTAATLFSLSIPRWCLLLGKNISLLVLLLALDAVLLAALCIVAEAPNNIPAFLLWLSLTLIVLTAFGNLVSLAQPFSIANARSDNNSDAPDGLAFGYVCVGAAAGLSLVPVVNLVKHGWIGAVGTIIYLLVLYMVSLRVSSTLVERLERRTIARLDRNGE